jgi:hypothetical protein
MEDGLAISMDNGKRDCFSQQEDDGIVSIYNVVIIAVFRNKCMEWMD